MRANFIKSLIAVVSGNLLYFFVLMPRLPAAAQHQTNRLDFGLVLDFWMCVVLWGVVDMVSRRLRRRNGASGPS
jgi:hypothetical protein